MTFFALGPLMPVFYFATGMIADKKPAELYREDRESDRFSKQARLAPQRSIRDVHSRFRALDRRLSDIERGVTTKNSALASEIDAL